MFIEAFITAIIIATGASSPASPDDVKKAQFFCCDTVVTDAEGERTGEGCDYVTEAESAKCESEVLSCTGSWIKSYGTVTCL